MNNLYFLICISSFFGLVIIGIIIGFIYIYKNNRRFLDKLQNENLNYIYSLQKENEAQVAISLNRANSYLIDSSTKNLEKIINPLKEDIKDFKNRSEDINKYQHQELGKLHEQLNNVLRTHNKLSEETNNLTNALKGKVKVQGNLGESILKRVLECSGLKKGINYLEQPTFNTKNGKRKPDFIIKLPQDRDIIIDSKLSLNSYLDYWNSSEDNKSRCIIEMENAFKNHIKSLSPKEYCSLDGLNSAKAVLIFIPIESIYLILADRFEKLFLEAGKNNIYVVTATSLMPLLQIVENMWQIHNRNENVEYMAKVAGTIYDKYAGMAEEINNLEKTINKALNDVNRQIDNFKTKFNGKGGLTSSVERLKILGADTNKVIPNNWKRDSELTLSSMSNLNKGE